MKRVLLIVVAAITISSTVTRAQNGPTKKGVGYSTVALALEALKARPDVDIYVQGGWTIVEDGAAQTLWSFTPADHAANPAVVKRVISQKGSGMFIDMSTLCEGPKPACDKLVVEFEGINERMRQSMGSSGTQKK